MKNLRALQLAPGELGNLQATVVQESAFSATPDAEQGRRPLMNGEVQRNYGCSKTLKCRLKSSSY